MTDLIFSRKAVADIDDITRFSVEQFGRDVAGAYLAGLDFACEQLRHFPEIAPIYPRVPLGMRCLIYRSHRIFYKFDGGEVLVVRVLHHARNVEREIG